MRFIIKTSVLAGLIMAGHCGITSAAELPLKADMRIESSDKCSFTAEPVNSTTWSVDWFPDGNEDSGVLRYEGDHAPLQIRVALSPEADSSCTLNTLKLTGIAPGSAPYGDAFRVKTSHTDGFWRYMPVLSGVTLFTSREAEETGQSGSIPPSIRDADNNTYIVQNSPVQTSMSPVENVREFTGTPAVTLTDLYMDIASLGKVYTVKAKSTESVKSALIGVGSILAQNPEDGSGKQDTSLINDNETVNMRFTVNISAE